MFGLEFDGGTIAQIVTLILGVLGSVFGGRYLLRVKRVFKAVKEGSDLFGIMDKLGNLVEKAQADSVVTKEEMQAIVEELGKLKPEFEEFKAALKAITAPIE